MKKKEPLCLSAARTEFLTLVDIEAAAAGEKHGPIRTMHEGYGILAEEVAEFFDEVRKKESARDPHDVLIELEQICAVCSRIATDVVQPMIAARAMKRGGQ